MSADFEFLEENSGERAYIVCADGIPAMRFVERDCDGNEITATERFIGQDGQPLTPARWVPGACVDQAVPFDMCDCIDENGRVYNAQNAGGGVFDVSIVNVATGAQSSLAQVTTSDLNALGLDAGNGFLYGLNRSTGEVFRIDIATGATTNLGGVPGLPTLPGSNFNFGDFDDLTGSYYVGGENQNVWKISLSPTLAAQQASMFSLLPGAGDMAFDECGRLWVSTNGLITRYGSFLQSGGETITQVPNNGSGYSGSFSIQNGVLVGLYGNNVLWAYNVSRDELTTSSGAIPGGASYDFAMSAVSPRYVGFKRLFTLDSEGALDTYKDYRPDGEKYQVAGNARFGICPDCSCSGCDDGGGGDGSGITEPVAISFPPVVPATHSITSGTGAIPAGLKAVRVKARGVGVTINGYTMNNGEILNLVATQSERVDAVLPTISPSGGSWSWVALDNVEV